MGLFKKLKKGLSKLWGGIKKVFGKIMKPIAKFLGSDFGKILMLAVTIWTLGTALMAGAAAWGNTTGTMMTKFIAAAKDFGLSLIGQPLQSSDAALTAQGGAAALEAGATSMSEAATVAAEQSAAGLTEVAGGAGAAEATAAAQGVSAVAAPIAPPVQGSPAPGMAPGGPVEAAGGVPTAASNAQASTNPNWWTELQAERAGAPVQAPTQSSSEVFGTSGSTSVQGGVNQAQASLEAEQIAKLGKNYSLGGGIKPKPSLFSRAGVWDAAQGFGTGLLDFAKTPGGGITIGQMVSGMGEGMMYKEILEDERRYRRKLGEQWRDYDWSNQDFSINSRIGIGDNVSGPRTFRGRIRMGEQQEQVA